MLVQIPAFAGGYIGKSGNSVAIAIARQTSTIHARTAGVQDCRTLLGISGAADFSVARFHDDKALLAVGRQPWTAVAHFQDAQFAQPRDYFRGALCRR
jgi:hypothetical protein